MPVPRLFEASSDPREQWVHVLATLLGLGGPETRSALVEEISGEALPDADAIFVREQRPLVDGPPGLVGDVVARGAGWTLAIQASLAFDDDQQDRLIATYDALTASADKCIVIAVTPDRRPPAAVEAAAAGGRNIRHRSWLRLRDWVQERPERGRVQAAADLLLLREAEYFLTPRVAELYRLEGLMPMVAPALRASLAAMFFDLNELAPAPLIRNEAGAARVCFPRTGSPSVEIALADGGLALRLASAEAGPGYHEAEPGWATLNVGAPSDYLAGRAWTRATALSLLPARR